MNRRFSAPLALLMFLLLNIDLGLASRLVVCDPGCSNDCEWSADYVVVGSGPGGSPLIRKLSDDTRYSVIGLEAGPNYDDDPLISQGANVLGIGAYGNMYHWMMKDAQQNDLSLFEGTGGASAHNGMQSTGVSNAYANLWQSYGGPKWGPASLAAASKDMETFTTVDGPAPSNKRGTNGPLNVRRPAVGPTSGSNSLASRLAGFVAAKTGIPVNDDYNDPNGNQVGPFVRYQMLQTPNGTRSSAWSAYLPRNVLQKNGVAVGSRQLRVLFESQVTKILFDGNRAYAVVFIRNGRENIVRVRKEVILATSVFTTQLLQVSGVGPAALLQANGIKVVANNSFVGKRSFNHPSVFVPLAFNPVEFPGLLTNDPAALYAGGAYLPSWDGSGPIALGASPAMREYQIGWFSNLFAPNTLFALVSHLRPKSVGSQRIFSANPLRIPYHDDGLMTHPDDADDFATFLFAFQGLVDYMNSQDSSYGIGWQRWNSVEDAKAFILANLNRSFHYGGQTPMGLTSASGAVNPSCRVYGTKNVRVSGSPVFPEVVDATLSYPATLVGHVLSDILISER